MAPLQSVTETAILRLRIGIDPENTEAFIHLAQTIKSQPGFVRQFWGVQVEDPEIFVWSMDWESLEAKNAFSHSDVHDSFMAGVAGVFDLETAPPLTMYTRWTSDVTAALEAEVTEVSIYTLPTDSYNEELRTNLMAVMDMPSMGAIKTIGKSPGAAIGWVFQTQNAEVPDGHTFALHGIFGYPSVEYHHIWRASPEHAQLKKEMGSSPLLSTVDMRPANLPGGGIFVADEPGMFHVKFHAGC